MPNPVRLLLAAALGLATALLVACGGSSKLIPAGNADALSQQLDMVSTAVQDHNCTDAVSQARDLRAAIMKLPRRVDAKLRRALRQSADELIVHAQQDCSDTQTDTVATDTTTVPSTPTQTTPSTPSTSSTPSTPSTSSTPSTPSTPSPPSTPTGPTGGGTKPGNGGGGGGNGGAGTGNGGKGGKGGKGAAK
jgi:hypothetical protein